MCLVMVCLVNSHVQSVTALMPIERDADCRRRQYVATMETRAIRLTVNWKRDM